MPRGRPLHHEAAFLIWQVQKKLTLALRRLNGSEERCRFLERDIATRNAEVGALRRHRLTYSSARPDVCPDT